MNERPTPETDAMEAYPATKLGLGDDAVVPAEFARKLERERDEARGAIQSTIAWLKERRKAHDFTTLRMIEERFLKVLEVAK